MDLPVNHFKHAILQRSPLPRETKGSTLGPPGSAPIGTWLMSTSASTAEALGCVGFDFLVVDMEHVPIDTPQVIGILRAIAGTPAQAVVRLPWNDAVMVKRALDAGAQTLMFPFVQDAEEARRAVASTRYPPEGTRGVAAMHRGSRFGTVPDYLRRANAEVCVVVQIETLAALGRLPEIAAVPGVDSIFVGPGDLSASMGHLGNMHHADVQQALARAAATCRERGKPAGIVGPTPEMVARFLDYGYTWAAVASDMAMMLALARQHLSALRAPRGDARGEPREPADPRGIPNTDGLQAPR